VEKESGDYAMNKVFAIANSIVSPLGLSASETFKAVSEGISGLCPTNHDYLTNQTYNSVFSQEQWAKISAKTQNYNLSSRFEQLLTSSIIDVITETGINPADDGTILVVATTKGNIDQLSTKPLSELYLHRTAKSVATAMRFVNTPIVISNACISGLSAIITAHRLLKSGQYHTAVVAGADVLGQFIISGFNALNALSTEPCRPFDLNRTGINLGEGSAAIVLKVKERAENSDVEILGGSITNDANHVSAPSRTGEELAKAISNALEEARLTIDNLQFVSAHGTATSYNDEMEAKALKLAGLSHLKTHSLKGYFGHTLGAAGIIESIVCFMSLRNRLFIPSTDFEQQGTSEYVNICTSPSEISSGAALKTMAGFGGCNAALVFQHDIR
jgi:3-oxoacyl-[acyl-carrier-protein] synthase-1